MATFKHRIPFKKNSFELKAWEEKKVVCGIDEAGRGCLAGPVVVGAAIIPPGTTYRLLKDSKLLDRDELLKAYTWIQKNCRYSYVAFDHKAIDTHNIYQATMKAMRRAFMQIMIDTSETVQIVCTDAMPLQLKGSAYESIDVAHFIKGERFSSSIAAASIVAKVNRDRIMKLFGSAIPGYEFENHKGYATTKHREYISQIGRSLVHRLSYSMGDKTIENYDENNQQSICGSN
jgi:ribonuclease HII